MEGYIQNRDLIIEHTTLKPNLPLTYKERRPSNLPVSE